CGVCMFSPCSQGVSSTKDPNRKKHAKITEHMSIPDQRWTVHFTWSRALQAAHCSWGVLEEGRSRMGKKQKLNSLRSQAYPCVCVCVCPVSPPYMHVCVPVCRVCH